MNCKEKAIGRYLGIGMLVLTAGCGATPTAETSYYLLRGSVASISADADAPRIGIAAVQVPTYLHDDGIVVELDDGRIRSARGHLWAEPLEHGLRHALINALEAELGQAVQLGPPQESWHEQVIVHVEQMHGSVDGDFVFHAGWRVVDTDAGATRSGRVSVNERQLGEGYDALVEMHMQQVRAVAREIAMGVRELRAAPMAE